MNPHLGRLRVDEAAAYRICVQGRLKPDWSDYFNDMQIEVTNDENANPVSVLTGVVTDQPALVGILGNLLDWRYPLLSVEYLDGRYQKG